MNVLKKIAEDHHPNAMNDYDREALGVEPSRERKHQKTPSDQAPDCLKMKK